MSNLNATSPVGGVVVGTMLHSEVLLHTAKDILFTLLSQIAGVFEGQDPIIICGVFSVTSTFFCWMLQYNPFSPIATDVSCMEKDRRCLVNNECKASCYNSSAITEEEVRKLIESPQYQHWFQQKRESLHWKEVIRQWFGVLYGLVLVASAVWALSCPSFFSFESISGSCGAGQSTVSSPSFRTMILELYVGAMASSQVTVSYLLCMASLSALFITLLSVAAFPTSSVIVSHGLSKPGGVYSSRTFITRVLDALLSFAPRLRVKQEGVLWVSMITLVFAFIGMLYSVSGVTPGYSLGYGFCAIAVIILQKIVC